MKTTVVNLKHEAFDVYIGRAATRASDARCHEESMFANPFPLTKALVATLGDAGARRHVIEQFRQHLLNCLEENPGVWVPALRNLKGKRLGCWCKPLACHGDVLAEFAQQMVTEQA